MNERVLSGFGLVLRSWRMVLWLYGVNFVLGLLVLLPAYSTLRREMGSSLEYLKVLSGFDFTVYSDFRQAHGAAVDPLLTVGFGLGLLYALLTVFFSGGILVQLTDAGDHRQTFRLSRFLAASVHGFGRFFRLALCVCGFCLLLAFFFLLAGGLGGLSLSDHLNEEGLSYFALICLAVFSLAVLVVLCVGDYARILLFRRDETRAFPVFWEAMRFVFSHSQAAFGNYLLLLGVGLGCLGGYFLLESWIVTSGWAEIGLLFLVQQFFIFARIFLKSWTLATAMTVVAGQEKQPIIS